MIGHDAPLHLATLDRWLSENDPGWPGEGRRYAEAGRTMFHRGFMQVQPTLYLGGHYHHHIDELVHYGNASDSFQTRVVLLEMNGSATPTSQAILNTATLDLEYLGRTDDSVLKLTGDEDGMWLICTDTASYVADPGAATITLLPCGGDDASDEQQAWVFSGCRIGETASWTKELMEGEGRPEVTSIERLPFPR